MVLQLMDRWARQAVAELSALLRGERQPSQRLSVLDRRGEPQLSHPPEAEEPTAVRRPDGAAHLALVA
jgi:hypothetical protein